MSKKILVLLMALVMLLSFSACKNDEDAEFDWGTHSNGVYENGFFNFSLELPENYNYLTPQEIIDRNAEPDENGVVSPLSISDIEDLSAEPLVHYIYGTKYVDPPLNAFNPYINIFSENMSNTGNIFGKEDYVENSLQVTSMIFTQAGVGIEVMPLEKLWFGDRQFAKGTMKIDYDMFTMYQEMYVVTKSNYSLVILIGYSTPSEKDELYSILQTISMK